MIHKASDLKVLHLGKYYPPSRGGIESLMEQTLLGLRTSGVDVSGLVFNEARPETVHEVRDGIHLTRLGTSFNLAGSPVNLNLARHLGKSEADIVHLHWPNPFALLAFLASGSKAKLVFAHHSDIIRQKVLGLLFAPFLFAGLRRADSIIVTSRAMIEASSFLKPFQHKCVRIPYGIDQPALTDEQKKQATAIRQKYTGSVLLAVGRLVYYKGFRYAIEAMQELDSTLLIVGDGPLRGELEHLTVELGVQDRVHLLGNVRDTRHYYHAADIFLLPSIARSEGFGIVQLEAMAAGVPVVNTWLPSTVPLVSLHGRTGLTVPPREPVALACAIKELLENPDRRREMGAAGIQRFREEFHAPVMVERTLAHYHSV